MSTESLERAFASTRSVLANVTPDELSNPTPCQSWQVRELINHIIGVSFWFADTVNTGIAPAPPDTDFTRGDMVATYDDGIEQAVAAFGATGRAREDRSTLPFGTLPGAVYMGIATTDAFTHGWDLARATGQSTDLDPDARRAAPRRAAHVHPARVPGRRRRDALRPRADRARRTRRTPTRSPRSRSGLLGLDRPARPTGASRSRTSDDIGTVAPGRVGLGPLRRCDPARRDSSP